LEWSGQSDFASQELRDWLVDGKPAGKTRSAGAFTFATINGAGHMVRNFYVAACFSDPFFIQVPYDKPKESLELVNRWISGQSL